MEAWTTKDAVIRDLAEAMGKKMGRLDEQYLVVGERPPPPNVSQVDQEDLDLLFGSSPSSRNIRDGPLYPDLDGITQMLRMVSNEEEYDDTDCLNIQDTIVTITKAAALNPNVKEFVPRSAPDPSPSSSNVNDKKTNNNITLESNSNNTDNIELREDDTVTKSNGNIKLNDLTAQDLKYEDFKTIERTLKSKINESSKQDTFESKKQKNVAIATLLKLYAKSPSPKQKNNNVKPLTLMTPEDFVKNKNVLKSDTNRTEDISSVSKEACTSDVTSTLDQVNCHEAQIASTCKVSVAPVKTDKPKKPTCLDNDLRPEIEASIAKVNRWLDGPVVKKSPTLCFEPVSFQKKVPSASSSPSKVEQKGSTREDTIKQYKPSTYAMDLGKKYLEKQQKTSKNKRNMWVDLEDILKEKDLAIKKRQEEASLNGSIAAATD